MKRPALVAAAILITAALAWAWAQRFEVVRGADNGFFLVNRWTGTVYWCHPKSCRLLPEYPQ